MLLKKLELQGFKSFVDYTALDIEPGITAIIGPNGCGKSNVVDGIRWVLGEQSAKALRGAHMEDVIFNGTDQRKAVGMAEVSLTIDNQSRLLASEHSEIMITRRTFRSGESEYLLNKVPCRLRDIHDLFMDTGIGTNAYSILEQGKIDLIVSSRPADRRFVFEEAAGISKFKSRKEESLRKLEATEQNLLRVSDIAAEVRRQIGSLERQVQKARRYQELKQELTTLEVSEGRRTWKQRRHELHTLDQRWQEHREQLEAGERRRLEGETLVQGLNQSLHAAEEAFHQAQASLHQVQSELIQHQEFIAASRLRQQDLQHSAERQAAELGEIDQKEAQLRAQNAGVLNTREQIQTALTQARNELQGEDQRLNQLENELKERASRVQDRQGRLLKLVDQMSSLRGSLRSLELRQGEHEQQLERQRQRLEGLRDQRQGLGSERERVHLDRTAIDSALTGLRGEGENLGQQKERLEHTLTTLDAMLEHFTKSITQLSARLNWIEELKNGLDGYDAGAKSILLEHHAHPEELPGILGPLVNFVRTDAKYEFAFEALLGRQLQYILVQNEAQALAAMAFLAKAERGRATFVPLELDRWTPEEPRFGSDPEWLQQAGVIGWAAQLVRIDERFHEVFTRLLKGVLLVQDWECVKSLRAAGARCTLLTLSGEVDSADRFLTGGSSDLQERGLLGREREIEELKTELELLERNLGQAQTEHRRTRAEWEETVGGLKANQSELHELEIKAAQLVKAQEALDANLTELERQQAELSAERDQTAGSLTGLIQDHQATLQQLIDLERSDRQTQEELTLSQDELAEFRQEYDGRSQRAGELRVQVAASDQQLRSLNQENERVLAELSDLDLRRQEKRERIGHDQARLQTLEGEIAAKQGEMDGLIQVRAERERSLSQCQQARELRSQERADEEARLHVLQSELDAQQRTLHHLDLERTELKLNLQSLESYLETEYQLNLLNELEQDLTQPPVAETVATPEASEERVKELKQRLTAMGSVNLVAMEEYDELQQRNTFLTQQLNDLKEARENLQKLIGRINQESKARFVETFEQVRDQFRQVFRRLFNGGDADLVLIDEQDLLETGIEIIARPPGKRLQSISLLSGGEKALTAIALLFAIFLIKPSPFCIFDEMDAPLDDINTMRFCRIVKEFAERSQFIIITHNKITMETAKVLYGVTMQESGVSKLVSVKLKGEPEPRNVEPILPVSAERAVVN